ncbi:helix-turn-helix domain-containing protein [Herbidospora galbida]|uniref:helix-turn-helix domain-containing protein n=1 Tax=Herbidospora galbida TaxID=2575442 RepID=UPI001FECD8FC|nr:LysR family transcriptional regulator [Herbidospora galbida]
MLDVRRLRLLSDLDRLGTIAAVAAVHAYTPSAVSQQLAALERKPVWRCCIAMAAECNSRRPGGCWFVTQRWC